MGLFTDCAPPQPTTAHQLCVIVITLGQATKLGNKKHSDKATLYCYIYPLCTPYIVFRHMFCETLELDASLLIPQSYAWFLVGVYHFLRSLGSVPSITPPPQDSTAVLLTAVLFLIYIY